MERNRERQKEAQGKTERVREKPKGRQGDNSTRKAF